MVAPLAPEIDDQLTILLGEVRFIIIILDMKLNHHRYRNRSRNRRPNLKTSRALPVLKI